MVFTRIGSLLITHPPEQQEQSCTPEDGFYREWYSNTAFWRSRDLNSFHKRNLPRLIHRKYFGNISKFWGAFCPQIYTLKKSRGSMVYKALKNHQWNPFVNIYGSTTCTAIPLWEGLHKLFNLQVIISDTFSWTHELTGTANERKGFALYLQLEQRRRKGRPLKNSHFQTKWKISYFALNSYF